MIKCIAIDMDGTLLNSEGQITKENIAAIKAAQQQGIEIVIATGRTFQESVVLLENAVINCAFICVNGAEVRSVERDIIAQNPFQKEVARAAYSILTESGMYVEFITNKGIFSLNRNKGEEIFEGIAKLENPDLEVNLIKEQIARRTELVEDVNSYDILLQNNDYEIYKLLSYSFELSNIEEAKQALKEIEGIAVSSSGRENIEVNDRNAQKGVALEKFVLEKGLSFMETMAIGDNYNDLSMLQRVGRSVAMGNADDEIKQQCHFVTETNDNSGVAKAIMALFS